MFSPHPSTSCVTIPTPSSGVGETLWAEACHRAALYADTLKPVGVAPFYVTDLLYPALANPVALTTRVRTPSPPSKGSRGQGQEDARYIGKNKSPTIPSVKSSDLKFGIHRILAEDFSKKSTLCGEYMIFFIVADL